MTEQVLFQKHYHVDGFLAVIKAYTQAGRYFTLFTYPDSKPMAIEHDSAEEALGYSERAAWRRRSRGWQESSALEELARAADD